MVSSPALISPMICRLSLYRILFMANGNRMHFLIIRFLSPLICRSNTRRFVFCWRNGMHGESYFNFVKFVVFRVVLLRDMCLRYNYCI